MRNILAPIDMSEPSANALRVADAAGLITTTGATLLHAFLPVAKSKMSIVGVEQASIERYVESERQKAMDDLVAFLAANGFEHRGWPLRVVHGEAMDVISRTVEIMLPDLLIMGMHGRTGLLKSLLGSVTEEALCSLDVDLLVVPPARR